MAPKHPLVTLNIDASEHVRGTDASSRLRDQFGLTLVELLVAVLLSALLAVIAWRGLDHVARSSQQVVSSTDRSQRLNQVMSQLEVDLMEAAQLRQSGQFAVQIMSFPVAEGSESSWLLLQRPMTEQLPARALRWVRWDVRDGVLNAKPFGAWPKPSLIAWFAWHSVASDWFRVEPRPDESARAMVWFGGSNRDAKRPKTSPCPFNA
jgi:prepilin-type N-terminal cleavage/methylation domain-containing protein